MNTQDLLVTVHDLLLDHFGPQHWWPARTPFEVVVGAILTQNTNWNNVEKAIGNLRAADALDVAAVGKLRPDELEDLIRPSGFFRQKAERLLGFVRLLAARHRGSLESFFDADDRTLRARLLAQPGIGPETADSILLYAAGRPSFVVDAYTRRIFTRFGILTDGAGYDTIRALFMDNLPGDVALFNEYHALIVRLAKEICRKRQPDCRNCPLRELCATGRSTVCD